MEALVERLEASEKKKHDPRSVFQKDKCRVLHSFAFRRLGGKMQIYGNHNSDFHRTRLTHSLEVGSVARNIAHALKTKATSGSEEDILLNQSGTASHLSEDLIETLGLLHDIGHPPFGHGGEVALNFALNRHSQAKIGFEGNAQSLKIAKKLNLSRRTLLGLIKYPIAYQNATRIGLQKDLEKIQLEADQSISLNHYSPPKCFYEDEQPLMDWLFSPFEEKDRQLFFSYEAPTEIKHGQSIYKTLDCSIMDLADDITYCIHDLEDAIFLRLLQERSLRQFKYEGIDLDTHFKRVNWQSPILKACDSFTESLFKDNNKSFFSHLINEFIVHSHLSITNHEFMHPLFKWNATLPTPMHAFITAMKAAIQTCLVFSQENQSIVFGGQILIMKIFEAIQANPDVLLNDKDRALYFNTKDPLEAFRVISDYISGMTDQYAQHLYQRLYGLSLHSIFQRL